jgi:hypothetical protein
MTTKTWQERRDERLAMADHFHALADEQYDALRTLPVSNPDYSLIAGIAKGYAELALLAHNAAEYAKACVIDESAAVPA